MVDGVLAGLIAPIPGDVFMSDYWLRRAVHQSGDAGRFGNILKASDLEFLVTSLVTSQPGWLSFVRDGTEMPLSSIRSANGFISARAYRHARSNGFTTLLSSLQRRWPAIAEFCRSLEGNLLKMGVPLSRPIVANAYATPAAARGFTPHYDEHEVLVLQLEGRKQWRLYRPGIDLPIRRMAGALPPELVASPVAEILMKPGDILYIPRGHPHDANATDEPTLHLTLAIHCHTWLDMAMALLGQSPTFRSSLPPVAGGSPDQGRVWSEGLRKKLQQFTPGTGEAMALAAELRESFVLSIEPALQRFAEDVASAATLTVKSRVVACAGSFCQPDIRSNGATLLYPGGAFHAGMDHRPAFDYIANHATFVVEQLPGLGSEAKVRVITELVNQGVLIPAPDLGE